jgi:phenylacetate-CoA ligase
MHPWLVRHLMIPLHERLLGRSTFACFRELTATQWLTPDALRTLQRAKLRELLVAAVRECSFYRRRFAERGLTPDRGDPFDVLGRLPLIDKSTLKSFRADLTNARVPGGPIPFNTGGSTGEPLIFFFDRRRIAYDKAARMRSHAWFGAGPGSREIYLWGSPAELSRQDRLRNLRDGLTNEKLLSAFCMSPERMRDYLRQIETYRPVSLFGYPSSLALLCEFGEREGVRVCVPSLKVVFVTGEVCDDGQRQGIEAFFGVPVANGYGSREGGFLAHECPHGSMHVTAESVVLEIVDEAGCSLPIGESGEVVVTHLDNYAMPFIRYRTGDVGRLLPGVCRCGRGLPRMDVVAGRRTDHLVAADGTLAHALSLIYVLREIDAVREFRIHQRRDRSVDVLVVPGPVFCEEHRVRIRRGVQRRLGEAIPVRIRLVDTVEPLPSGKHRYVISEAAGALTGHLQTTTLRPQASAPA